MNRPYFMLLKDYHYDEIYTSEEKNKIGKYIKENFSKIKFILIPSTGYGYIPVTPQNWMVRSFQFQLSCNGCIMQRRETPFEGTWEDMDVIHAYNYFIPNQINIDTHSLKEMVDTLQTIYRLRMINKALESDKDMMGMYENMLFANLMMSFLSKGEDPDHINNHLLSPIAICNHIETRNVISFGLDTSEIYLNGNCRTWTTDETTGSDIVFVNLPNTKTCAVLPKRIFNGFIKRNFNFLNYHIITYNPELQKIDPTRFRSIGYTTSDPYEAIEFLFYYSFIKETARLIAETNDQGKVTNTYKQKGRLLVSPSKYLEVKMDLPNDDYNFSKVMMQFCKIFKCEEGIDSESTFRKFYF